MTDREILEKVIDKLDNSGIGYSLKKWWKDQKRIDEVTKGEDGLDEEYRLRRYYFIFSHEFAKAFWGMDKDSWFESDQDKEKYEQKSEGRGYRYHLQQMVLEENPLNYLEKFI